MQNCDAVEFVAMNSRYQSQGRACRWSLHHDNRHQYRRAKGIAAHFEPVVVYAWGNVQLYQRGIQLQAGMRYRLSFAAYSSTGRDLGVYVHNHQAPYNNYGLSIDQVNLGTNWQLYTYEFTANGSAGDARLRFWLAPFAQAGDV